MAKYITRANPVSVVNIKVANAQTDSIEVFNLNVCDLPNADPARINAVKRELKAQKGNDVMLMRINSVTAGSGYYRMLQTEFVKYAEYIPETIPDEQTDE